MQSLTEREDRTEALFRHFLTLILLLFVTAFLLGFGVYLILQHRRMEVKNEVIKIPIIGAPISILVSFSIFIQQLHKFIAEILPFVKNNNPTRSSKFHWRDWTHG